MPRHIRFDDAGNPAMPPSASRADSAPRESVPVTSTSMVISKHADLTNPAVLRGKPVEAVAESIKELRQRILSQGCSMYDFSASYAHKIGDSTFNLRLALGLARSFATSTRFVLDKKLARAMWLRARYLIELVLATNPKQVGKFRVPVQEIFNV